MSNREIDYDALIENYEHMINTMEYDSMRSGGKARMNAQTLYYMMQMKMHYESLKKKTPAKGGTK